MIRQNLCRIIFIFFLILSLSVFGCTHSVTVYPKELPVAQVGQPYYVEIEIKGSTPVVPRSFYSEIMPNNGLKVDVINSSNQYAYNYLKVFGVPIQSGNIKLKISGFTYGTNFVGAEFEKTYIIKVKNSE